jgi:hypothetical protein
MMMRVGVQGWSAWIVYLIVGLMQFVLIAMGVAYSVRDWQRPPRSRTTSATPSNRPSFSHFQFGGWNGSRQSMVSSNVAPDEHRPLLAGHRSGGSTEAVASPAQQIG